MDWPEINKKVDDHERICKELCDVRAAIDTNPSSENLRRAVQKTIDLLLVDADIQDLELDDLRERLVRIERKLGLHRDPPASGGGRRRGRNA